MATRMNRLAIVKLAIFSLMLALVPEAAFAIRQGVFNTTNKPGSAGGGCGSCHNPQGGAVASVTITGPATLDAGASGIYTVTATQGTPSAGVKMGFNAAADDGLLSVVAGESTVTFNGEVSHSTNNAGVLHATTAQGTASYQFRYTMPGSAASGSTRKLYAVATLGGEGIGWQHAPDFTVTTGAALTNPPRLMNISTRSQVLTGDNVLIGGFIIGGSAAKTVVVRARGPSLTPLGVPGAMANPQMTLFAGQTQIANNNDWSEATNAQQIQQSGFAPENGLEAAILMTLQPGAYTAIVTGVNNGTGIAIVEVFEVDAVTVPLINISSRSIVQTGDNVMIGGFIIQGSGPQTVVIRARGPSLAAAGVTGVLANPQMTLFAGQTQIANNDNWGDAPNKNQIIASGQAPTDANESAIMMSLQPGAYTAIVTGVNSGTGIGIVEVFTTSTPP